MFLLTREHALCIMHNKRRQPTEGPMLRLPVPENFYLGTKKDYVAEAIRTGILTGDIVPGTRITEQQVKDLLKVSSSPIREAFHQLEAEGLLTKHPHVGSRVTEMDVKDARELYSIQSLLQGTAVQICAYKLRDENIVEAERLNNEMRTFDQPFKNSLPFFGVYIKSNSSFVEISIKPEKTLFLAANIFIERRSIPS